MTWFFLIGGIEQNLSDDSRWTARAKRWIETDGRGGEAAIYNYRMGVGGMILAEHGLHVRQAAAMLAEMLAGFGDGDKLVIVAHSHGCMIAADILREVGPVTRHRPCDVLHLIAPACSASFSQNGLNEAVLRGNVKQIHVWYSRADVTLQIARDNGWMGYGTLGLTGPRTEMMIDEAKAVTYADDFTDDGYDHGSYFLPEYFTATMRGITA